MGPLIPWECSQPRSLASIDSSDTGRSFQPQGLCTCFPLCREDPSSCSHSNFFWSFFLSFIPLLLSLSVTHFGYEFLSLKKEFYLRLPQSIVREDYPKQTFSVRPFSSPGWCGDQPCALHSLDTCKTLRGRALGTSLGGLLFLTVSSAAPANPAAEPTGPWPDRGLQREVTRAGRQHTDCSFFQEDSLLSDRL